MCLPYSLIDNRYSVNFVQSVGPGEMTCLGAMHVCGGTLNFACENQYDAELCCEVYAKTTLCCVCMAVIEIL